MSKHPSNIVYPAGPDDKHAFDNIPLLTQNGALDAYEKADAIIALD